jgi:hypothetical protein
VSAAQVGGRVPFVEIRSEAGATCRVANPWPGRAVTLHRDGKPAEKLTGEILSFPTRSGESLIVMPEATAPEALKIAIPAPPSTDASPGQ